MELKRGWMMAEQDKKETRIMKVTLSAKEFAKYDKGITHSDKGLRTDKGHMSALPDISPVSEEDLPTRTVYIPQPVNTCSEKPTFGQVAKQEIKYAAADTASQLLNDPYVQAAIWNKAKNVWHNYIKPLFTRKKKDIYYQTKAEQLLAQRQNLPTTDVTYEIETVNKNHERILVTGEQAEQLVASLRQEARKLSAMIYLLSNIAVKDDKNGTEYTIEEECIKQLISEEATSTMQTLVAHRQLIDEDMAICFDDWLNGYIRNGEQRIQLTALRAENSKTL